MQTSQNVTISITTAETILDSLSLVVGEGLHIENAMEYLEAAIKDSVRIGPPLAEPGTLGTPHTLKVEPMSADVQIIEDEVGTFRPVGSMPEFLLRGLKASDFSSAASNSIDSDEDEAPF